MTNHESLDLIDTVRRQCGVPAITPRQRLWAQAKLLLDGLRELDAEIKRDKQLDFELREYMSAAQKAMFEVEYWLDQPEENENA